MPGEAGYSGTPLPKKLGIEEMHKVTVVNAPEGFGRTLGRLPPGATVVPVDDVDEADVALVFATEEKRLRRHLDPLVTSLATDGGLWACWPKGSSGVETDLGRERVREVVVGHDPRLVDNKVCAIDETWSGLRFVIRKEHR